MRKSPRPSVIRICEYCSTQFTANQSRVDLGRAKFCSHKCKGLNIFRTSQSRKQTSEDFWGPHNNPRFAQIAIKCLTCGVIFRTRGSKLGRKYCSAVCYHKQRGTKTGKYVKVYKFGKIVYEHRWVMQNHLKRLLRTEEEVHHVNGDRSDNRIENLVIVDSGLHQTQHNNGGTANILGPADRSMPFRP